MGAFKLKFWCSSKIIFLGWTNMFWGVVLHVACHLSLMPEPQPQTLSLLTPPLSAVGWLQNPPFQKKQNKKKQSVNWKKRKIKMVSSQANIRNTPFDQKSPGHSIKDVLNGHNTQTDIQTDRQTNRQTVIAILWLNWLRGRFSENNIIYCFL